jgi:hypothetical protein
LEAVMKDVLDDALSLLEEGKTLRMIVRDLGIGMEVPVLREQLYARFGKKKIRSIVQRKVMPPAIKQVTGLLKTASDVVRAPLRILATKEEVNRRRDICNNCIFEEHGRCSKCACVISTFIHVQEKKCEADKW